MGRIASNLGGIERALLNRLAQSNAQITLANLRLATGQRVNAAADDPVALVRISQLDRELNQVNVALANVTGASTLVSGAQLVIDQVKSQLETIRELAVADEDGALDADERAANQAAIDTALAEIRRLVGTTVAGRRLADGSADYHALGRNYTQVQDLEIAARGDQPFPTISGQVTAAATRATLTHAAGGATIASSATFTLEGIRGQAVLSVTAGETLAAAAARINQASHRTGVTVAVSAGTNLVFSSVDYGSEAIVSLNVTSGSFAISGGASLDAGTDALATLNGQALTGRGNRFEVVDQGLRYRIEFTGGFSGTLDEITVFGDALTFSLTTDGRTKSTLAVRALHPELLGGPSGRLSNLATGEAYGGLGNNSATAVRIVDEALAQVTRAAGRVEGFATSAIESSNELLGALRTELTTAQTEVNGVVDEEEATKVAHYQALADNAVAGLAIFTQQRASIVALIQQIAGLG